MEWFTDAPTFEKIFWLIAITASLFFLIQLVLTLFGADMDGDLDIDAEIDGDTGIGFQFVSLKNLVAFFTLFGWVGIACIQGDLGKGMTIILSTLSGLAMMTLMATIYYYSSKLNYSGTLVLSNAVGLLGEAYMPIPAKKGGHGKIHIKIQGALRELDALTDDEIDIDTGSIIEVIDITNQTLIVTKK
jgi:membrane protein implicated in regulation of membrane protease activity